MNRVRILLDCQLSAVGDMVYTIDDVNGSNAFELNLSHGIYFYSIHAENTIHAGKILIE